MFMTPAQISPRDAILADNGCVMETYAELGDDSGHHVQHLRIPRLGDIPAVIAQNSIKEPRDEILVDTIQILRLADIRVDQLQDLLLDGAK